ncbi:hypothetical protein FBF54_20120 [Klebsiella pneumoniae]|nr:hypothetical protein FBF55_17385 [Klebsiella pneumoniae]QHU74940.1 hypothetical protein FBF54_20120 [Klebsiella pneumoniae]
MFAGKKSAQIREILISESAWEEMTCLFAPSLMNEGSKKSRACALLFKPESNAGSIAKKMVDSLNNPLFLFGIDTSL